MLAGDLYIIQEELPTNSEGTELGTDEEATAYLERWLEPLADKWEACKRMPMPGVSNYLNNCNQTV